MNAEVQSIAAITVVIVTVLLLIARVVRKRKQPGCGGDCGCPTDELKAKIAKPKRS
jgi:hypothetical protein